MLLAKVAMACRIGVRLSTECEELLALSEAVDALLLRSLRIPSHLFWIFCRCA